MHSMKHQDTLVVGGVDSHADTHHAAAMDQRGALLATKGFPTTTPGYRELLDWLCAFGEVDVVAVESTGSYAAALVHYLREHSVRVLEVNQPHAHTRRRRGKSDPIDAEMAARLALSGKATTVPKQTDGIVESIRLLRAARHSAVKSRSAAIVQLGGLIITAPQELREQLASAKTIRGKAALCRRLRPRPTSFPDPPTPRSSRCAPPFDGRSNRPGPWQGGRGFGVRGARGAGSEAARRAPGGSLSVFLGAEPGTTTEPRLPPGGSHGAGRSTSRSAGYGDDSRRGMTNSRADESRHGPGDSGAPTRAPGNWMSLRSMRSGTPVALSSRCARFYVLRWPAGG
jgi:hypothetical protein